LIVPDAQDPNPPGNFPEDLIACALGHTAVPWHHHVARGILADPATALERLASCDGPDLPYYRAVLNWLAHDDDAACRGLEQQPSDVAQALLELIRRPRIKVLTQIPFTGAGAFRLLEGIAADRRFEIRNIGRGSGDVALRPYDRVLHRVWDASSCAFYVCAMIEWQHPPFDLAHLPFPTIGFTSDFDAQFMSVAPWLKAFDHVLVCDQQVECRDVRALSSASVHAFPLVFCAPTEAPPLPSQPRDIDVLFSGTLFSSYQPDKAAIVHELLRIPDLRLVLIDGHVSHEDYHSLLSRARITQNFCRHPGAMLTRALESLSLGSIALVQEGSVHEIWGNPDTGVFTFRPGQVAKAVSAILRDYDRHGAACAAHAMRIREAFSARAVASRFFRYATVLAAQGRRLRTVNAGTGLTQRRHVFLIGPQPTVAEATRQCQDHLVMEHPGLHPTERLNLRARERVLLHCQALHERQPVPTGLLGLDRALNDLRHAVASDPSALVVRFNLVRVLMNLGNPADVREGEALALATFSTPIHDWRVDPGDDVYPWDFFGTWFNARAYLDTAVHVMTGRCTDGARLVELVIASLHHYVAVHSHALAHAREACRLDADFPYYALSAARLLVRSGQPEHHVEAAGILARLAASSEVAGAAYRELEALADLSPACGAALETLAPAFQRAEADVLIANRPLEFLRSGYHRRTRLLTDRQGGRDRRALSEVPRLSVLICGVAGRGRLPLLRALSDQRAAPSSYEVIYVDCFEAPPDVPALADHVLSCGQEGFFEHRLEALARALEHARAAVVTVVEPGSRVGADFVERLLAAYYASDDAETSASQHVTVAGWLDRSATAKHVAFPTAAARLAGGFDLHPVFTGNRGTPLELAWRLQQFGLPVVIDGDAGRTFGSLSPWWTRSGFSSEALTSSAALIWPSLFAEDRADALLSWRHVQSSDAAVGLVHVETTAFGFNILRYQSQFIAVRQTLGAIDFRVGLATLLRRFGHEHVVIGEDLTDVRCRAAALSTSAAGPPATPSAIHVEHGREFRVAKVGDTFVGIRNCVGAVNFDSICSLEALVTVFGETNVVFGRSREEIRDRMREIVGRPASA
jgi:hypothetical protein